YKPFLTSTVVDTKGISGALVSRGDLISRVLLHGGLGLSGIIAVEGNIGKTFTYASGTSVRRGGLLADGGVSGAVVALGTLAGDVQIEAGLRGGRIAAKGGMAGNVTINGGLDAGSAIVSGGEIGDTGLGTQLVVNGENKGILAAEGALHFGKGHLDGAVYNDTGATPQ